MLFGSDYLYIITFAGFTGSFSIFSLPEIQTQEGIPSTLFHTHTQEKIRKKEKKQLKFVKLFTDIPVQGREKQNTELPKLLW